MSLAKVSIAVVVAALLATAPVASHATCVNGMCVAGTPGAINTTGSTDPNKCPYVKIDRPPPPGWPPPDDGPPYVFWETKEWGNTYRQPQYWTSRACDVYP